MPPSAALLRRALYWSSLSIATSRRSRALTSAFRHCQSRFSTTLDDAMESKKEKKKGEWLTLPPFSSTIDGAELGKELAGLGSENKGDPKVTAIKWVLRCCPQLPRSLVQKLFRLRQVRRESSGSMLSSDLGAKTYEHQLRRVAAKDSMNLGDRICLPITVQELPSRKPECFSNEEEDFICSLELHKDAAIVVVNKPPGMPVQGGIGIRKSLDELAATYLRYDYPEPPRLVHRLDRDSSGILVMGRTKTSTTVLHSIFRERTHGASNDNGNNRKRILQRRYWALVIGSPRHPEGLISVPLKKVIVDNGKSERITAVGNLEVMSSQHAITEYRVIKSSYPGYTWLELSPLTGRKHQLRVHCAEVLGTPIVGDYKYGWQAHRKMKLLPSVPCSNLGRDPTVRRPPPPPPPPFGLDLENGSILEKQPYLHLHCKEMILPDVARALAKVQLISSDCERLTELDSLLKLSAPLPLHMEKSWNILNP
ncbi:RNA pseudouridine synthase 4, mitochondrial isoform X2 [Diospyros lotus]|uniref:RNA pseudouridine synthase 4, mitochondrial isoform X2 n=1 Tax=Diospyros lotus TaxID=55363 RepID=UPI0022509144|nr:RNA pseudouridine synthase 4, mitochondrial isoform X2 [Diospyros lotus]